MAPAGLLSRTPSSASTTTLTMTCPRPAFVKDTVRIPSVTTGWELDAWRFLPTERSLSPRHRQKCVDLDRPVQGLPDPGRLSRHAHLARLTTSPDPRLLTVVVMCACHSTHERTGDSRRAGRTGLARTSASASSRTRAHSLRPAMPSSSSTTAVGANPVRPVLPCRLRTIAHANS
jgi:hypothetical protein